MDGTNESAITQMRKSVETVGCSTEKYGDPTLLRFLIARSMNPEKAAKMFVQWHNWRSTFVPNGFFPDSEVQDELDSRKILLQGLSKDGHPLLIVKVRNHTPSKDQLQFKSRVALGWFNFIPTPSVYYGFDEFEGSDNELAIIRILRASAFSTWWLCKDWVQTNECYYQDPSLVSLSQSLPRKFVVHLLDKTIASAIKGREIGNEKLIAILDLHQITYKNVDVRGLITGFQFLQAYYPERLGKLFVLNMPRFFVTVWKMVSRFLEKATLEKIVILTSEEEKKDMLREIGGEAVPEEYGGQAKIVLLQDAVVPPLGLEA